MFPNKGTWVKKGNGSDRGVVEEIRCDEEYVQVHVRWLKNKETEWIEPEKLSNGFMIGVISGKTIFCDIKPKSEEI